MSPAPVCMAPGDSVSVAAQAMKRHGIGTVLVPTDGRLSGQVTDWHITVRVLAEDRDPRTMRIGDLAPEKDATFVPSGVSSAAPNS